MENLWLVVPAIILGCIGIIWFINWIDNYTPSKPIPKPKPKLGTFRIAPSNVIDMFYVEEYSYTVGMTFGDTLRIDWHKVQDYSEYSNYTRDKKFTEREAEMYIKERLDQLEAARIRNEALREFQSQNPPREVPPFHLLEDE